MYMQIMEHIRGAILMGEYKAGGRIPPVRELAAQAQVNPNTMQRALLELEGEGLLVTDGTVGRYVTEDTAVLETMRHKAVDALVHHCAAQFRGLGISMQDAAQMLIMLEEGEKHE